MAEKLSVTIALEGAEQIKKDLEGIGDAGEKAWVQIAEASTKLGGFKNLDPQRTTEALADMGVTGKEAVEKILAAVQKAARLESLVQGIKSVEGLFSSLKNTIVGSAAAFGPLGAAAVAAFSEMAAGILHAHDASLKLEATAMKLGMTFEQFAKSREAFRNVGLSWDEATKAVEGYNAAIEKSNVEKLKEIQDIFKKEAFVSSDSVRRLQEMAKGFGSAAEGARTLLKEIGVPVASDALIEKLARIRDEAAKLGGPGAGESALGNALKQVEDSAQRSAAAMKLLGTEVGIAFEQATRAGTDFGQIAGSALVPLANMKQSVEDIGTALTALPQAMAPLQQAGAQAGMMFDQFGRSAQEAIKAPITTFTEFGTVAGQAGSAAAQAGTDGADGVQQLTTAIGESTGAIENYSSALGGVEWDSSNEGVTAWNNLTTAIQGSIDAILQYLGLQAQSGGGGGSSDGGGGWARGGMIGGRGTGTSDSNLAWLSRGEYVTPARAVRQPGVLAFLEALRRSGGNLRRVLDGMGRFSLGGMVPRPMPSAFASGGVVGSNRDLGRLELVVGGTTVSGLVDAKIADALRRVAVKSQITSGGRKPSRYT